MFHVPFNAPGGRAATGWRPLQNVTAAVIALIVCAHLVVGAIARVTVYAPWTWLQCAMMSCVTSHITSKPPTSMKF